PRGSCRIGGLGEGAFVKIVVTGASGLLGWHTAVRLHARNCSAHYLGQLPPFELVTLDRPGFSDPHRLATALEGADAVLHFAGVNRAPEYEVERANPAIADTLAQGCRRAGVSPHIVYANSVHADGGSAYGRSKRRAGR